MLLVFEGNSLTVGTGGTSNRGWVTQLLDSLNTIEHKYSLNPPGGEEGNRGIGELYQYVNLATNGHKTSDILPDSSLIDSYFTTTPDTAILSVWMGDNDLANYVTDADSLYQIIKSYCYNRKLHGWKVAVGTIIPRDSAVVDSANYENMRQQVNTLIRENYQDFADMLFDFGDIPELQNPDDLDYYDADKIHLNGTGYGLCADLAEDVYRSIIYLKDYAYLSTNYFRELRDNRWYRLTFDLRGDGVLIDTTINRNSGFEADSGFIDWGTPTTNEQSSTQAHSGTYSRHIVGDETGDGFTDSLRFGLLTPYNDSLGIWQDRWYIISFWYYIESGALRVGEAYGILNIPTFTDDSTGAWIFHADTIQASATSGERFLFTTSGGAGEFYIDDYKVNRLWTPDLILDIAATKKTYYHTSPVGESVSETFIHDNTGDDNIRFHLSGAGTVYIDNIYLGK